MKISKLFGLVLSLHVGVIAMLVVQPGCSTPSPPTKSVAQHNTLGTDGASPIVPETSAQSEVVDSAFNANLPDARFETMRSNGEAPAAGEEFTEFETIEPLEPMGPLQPYEPETQTVAISETSYQIHTVKKGESLWKISRDYGVSVNELYAANGLNKNSVIKVGQEIRVPSEGGSAVVNTVQADTYQPTTLSSASTTYTVRKGDNLSKIASKFNTSVAAIKAANNKRSDVIQVGEELTIPVSGASQPAPAALAPAPAPASSPVTSSAAANGTHTVQSGEYPSKIAKQYGMSTKELMQLNNISDARSLQVGQVLKVKGAGSSAAAAPAARPVVALKPAEPAPAQPVTPAPAAAPAAAASESNLTIRVLEADPLVEDEASDLQNPDALFEEAEAIPVIRIEE